MALEIVWTDGAERDLLDLHLQLLNALDQDMELVARVLEQPLEISLRLLRDHPEIAPKVRGAQGLRRRLLGPQNRYGLFYVIERRGLLIHALLDLRQDPQTIWKRLREI